jgi:hypothetical protein
MVASSDAGITNSVLFYYSRALQTTSKKTVREYMFGEHWRKIKGIKHHGWALG